MNVWLKPASILSTSLFCCWFFAVCVLIFIRRNHFQSLSGSSSPTEKFYICNAWSQQWHRLSILVTELQLILFQNDFHSLKIYINGISHEEPISVVEISGSQYRFFNTIAFSCQTEFCVNSICPWCQKKHKTYPIPAIKRQQKTTELFPT